MKKLRTLCLKTPKSWARLGKWALFETRLGSASARDLLADEKYAGLF